MTVSSKNIYGNCGICGQPLGTAAAHLCKPMVLNVYSEKQYKDLESQLERVTKERDEFKQQNYELVATNISCFEENERLRAQRDKVLCEWSGSMDVGEDLVEIVKALHSDLDAKTQALQLIANHKVHSYASSYQLIRIAQQSLGLPEERIPFHG